ncbi:tRNA (adenosine(37)-N6)-threonylcarbamoyltransferase complex dimerization subunit type 1 TsaB [Telmatospirillum sp.]|uniref:tRNA (adenosine(37)-N6)-threonylcarbamoyltransferase complex dimerization subunit type 1 TsaB n=1 Tax=Telmatospirillum sp. TaxID=2079197 RepID=UPI00284C685A|nr:tRNA (adenosine(37)-N6)-threonylcarbamoyltransferase complex dimerization subunit type 1 TsaB [Telmatospirillum sp.]MDR3440413.1 tRNA (adenosine(37)-N6)-threonylcarbamoyltransferase complex dimerization subunit type 1 TsaB [Telmatospirillum sp.]
MTVLAFDCSTQSCSTAVLSRDNVLSWRFAVMARGQSEALMPMIEETLVEAGVGWADLELIGVTVGPGTFTGIRIGLAAARGMALAGRFPVAGVGSLEAVAYAVPEPERRDRTILVALDSKRADLFFQAFASDLTPICEPFAAPPEAAIRRFSGPLLLAGDAAERLAAIARDAQMSTAAGHPDARVVGRLAALRHQNGCALPPEPVYLRPPDVTLPATSQPIIVPGACR